jgi:hypothetical protein
MNKRLARRFFQQIGANLFIPAKALSPKPVCITSDAAVIGVGSFLTYAGTEADGLTVIGVATHALRANKS